MRSKECKNSGDIDNKPYYIGGWVKEWEWVNDNN